MKKNTTNTTATTNTKNTTKKEGRTMNTNKVKTTTETRTIKNNEGEEVKVTITKFENTNGKALTRTECDNIIKKNTKLNKSTFNKEEEYNKIKEYLTKNNIDFVETEKKEGVFLYIYDIAKHTRVVEIWVRMTKYQLFTRTAINSTSIYHDGFNMTHSTDYKELNEMLEDIKTYNNEYFKTA